LIEGERKVKNLEILKSDSILLEHALFGASFSGEDFENSGSPGEIQKPNIDLVFDQIHNLVFDTDPVHFNESLDFACNSKHGEYLAKRPLKVLQKMKTFKVKNYNIGFALKKDKKTGEYSEIVAVHNAFYFNRLGGYLLRAAERLGGTKLECFGEYLKERIYSAFGFVETNRKEGLDFHGRKETLYFMELNRKELQEHKRREYQMYWEAQKNEKVSID
jgi:hypothetical protein